MADFQPAENENAMIPRASPGLCCNGLSALNDYAKRFALYQLPRTKVGINFDTQNHTLVDWKIEEA